MKMKRKGIEFNERSLNSQTENENKSFAEQICLYMINLEKETIELIHSHS